MKKTTLYKGDVASLQSLSGGMAGDKNFYHKFKIGKKRIEDIGLNTVISKKTFTFQIKRLTTKRTGNSKDFVKRLLLLPLFDTGDGISLFYNFSFT